jgi:hypothetical protein
MNARAVRRIWPIWPLQLALGILFVGPLLAPLFLASGLPLIADSGALARNLLATYICPTPAKSYIILDHPMAVCARCWGATIGLLIAWRAVRGSFGNGSAWRRYLAISWFGRLCISLAPFGLWVAEIAWLPWAPLWLLLINGAFAGFWAGLFFSSIWPGLARRYA